MVGPNFVNCPKNVWTLVAAGVTTGTLHKWDKSPYGYLQTYVDAGDSAPTLKADGVAAFVESNIEIIAHTSLIDVYLYSLLDDGRVRVDI